MTAVHGSGLGRSARVPAGPWQRPQLRTPESSEHRSVSWLELFFDLVFVVVVSRLADHLAAHLELSALLGFAIQFLAVFWLWTPFAYYTERFESEGLETRFFTFLAMVPVAGLAVFGEEGLGATYVGFALAYVLTRAVNQLVWIRAAVHVAVFRPVAARFVAGYLVVAAIILASFAAPPGWHMAMFAIAVVLDVATPYTTVVHENRLPSLSTSSKFPERFGLFTLIVLGESVVGVIVGLSELEKVHLLGAVDMVSGVLGLAVGFALWWIYFDFVARRMPKPSLVNTLVWVQTHAVTLTAITVSGAGISVAIADSAHGSLGAPARFLLVGGVAVSLLGIGALQLTLAREPDEPTHPRLSPAMKIVVAAVLAVVGSLDLGWTTPWLLVLLLAGLAVPMCYGTYVWYFNTVRWRLQLHRESEEEPFG